jgi:hypothetical protein
MKKNIFISIIFFLVISGCKKDEQLRQKESQSISRIERLILDFEEKLGTMQKDGKVYSSDSAVWYVEALLNYNLGSVGITCSDFYVDSSEVILPIPSTGEYTLNLLQTVYSQHLNQIQENKPENTIFFAADLKLNVDEQLAIFKAHTAYATPVSSQFKAISDTSGYWYWGGEKGMCGPDSGQYVGLDAAIILQNRLSNTTSDIWTSLESFTVMPGWYPDPNFPFDITYLYETRMFGATGPINEILNFCISPEVMEYYLSDNGIPFIINDLMPQGKRFAYCFIQAGSADELEFIHAGGFTFGVPVQ